MSKNHIAIESDNILDHQYDTNGRVIQVSGTIFKLTQILINDWTNIQELIHTAEYLANKSSTWLAI